MELTGASVAVDGAAALELLTLEGFDNPDATSFRVRVPDEGADRTTLARLLAVTVVRALTEPSDTAFEAWQARLDGGPSHDEATLAEIEAYVSPDFKNQDNTTRLNGAVVEHLWALLASELEGQWGRPVYVEHDHFSVIDHGGDGFSLYEMEGCTELRFRVWESKCHDAQTASLTTTVTEAAKQLHHFAPEYVARVSKPLQLHEDERVRRLAGTIVRLWTSKDERSAVGVSVGTAQHVPSRPFQGLRREFDYTDPGRLEGLIIEFSGLEQFASEVRAFIVKGIQ